MAVRRGKARSATDSVLAGLGEAQRLDFDASSAATINAKDLKAEFCNAEASSAGSIRTYVSKEITTNASSGGDIDYWGEPQQVAVNESSGGSVSKK